MPDTDLQAGLDSFLAKESEFKATTLRNNWANSAGTSPDDFAKQIALSRATGIPPQSLFADPEEAQRHQALQGTDFTGLVDTAPKTTNFLLDPKNAGLYRDKVPELSAMEYMLAGASYLGGSTVAGLHDLAGAGAKLLDAMNPYTLSDMEAAGLYKNDPEKLQKIREAAASTGLMRFARGQTEASKKTMQQVSPEAKAIYDPLHYDTLGAGESAWRSPVKLASDAIRSLPTSAALLATVWLTRGAAIKGEAAALSAGVGARAEAEAIAGGMAAQAAKQAGEEAVRKAGVEAATNMAVKFGAASEGTVGYAQQALQTQNDIEGMSLDKLHKAPEFQKLIDQGYDENVARIFTAARAGEQAGIGAGFVDALTNAIGGKFLGKIIGEGGALLPRIAKGMGNEAGVEFVQSGGEQLFENIAKQANANPNQDLTENVIESMLQGLAIGGLTGGAFAGVLGRAAHEATVEGDAQHLADLFAVAAQVHARDPETFKQFFQSVAPDATVLIDPDKLQEVLLQADIDPAKLPSFIEQANTSQAGAGIEIPVHELIAAFTGTGAEAALIPHVRFGADMPTLAESREAGTKAAEFFQKEADRILEEQSRNEEFVAGAKAVQDDIKAQLDSLGRFGPQATSGYAALTGAFYTTMASQLGITPLQLRDGWTDAQGVARRGYKLSIGGTQNPATAQSLNQLEPATRDTFTGAGIPNLLKTDNWTILTAENPNAQKLSDEENLARNAELQQYLTAKGYDFTPVKGHYGQPENSFVVTGITPEQAQALAKKFEQESVLTRHGLVYQDGSITPSNGLTVHPSQPEDFYTTLPDGTHFTVGLDFEGPRSQLSDVVGQQDLFPETFADKNSTVADTVVVSSKGATEQVQRGNVNSEGRRIVPTMQALRNFWDWFSASEVVDSDGKPLVLYHSTKADVSEFETMRETTNTGLFGVPFSTKRAGIFLTPNKAFAEEYSAGAQGANTMPLYAAMQNPADFRKGISETLERDLEANGVNVRALNNLQYAWEMFEEEYGGPETVAALRAAGYDGAIINEDDANGEAQTTYVAFDPAQIKSASGNRGTFSSSANVVNQTARTAEEVKGEMWSLLTKLAETPPEKRAALNTKLGQLQTERKTLLDSEYAPSALHQTARDFQTVTPAQIDAIRKEVAWTETGTENGFPVWKNAQVALTSPVDVTEGHDVFYKPLGNERAVKYQIQDANGRSIGYTVLELADGWPTLLLDIEVAETERGKRYAEQTVAAIANDAGELGIWHIVPSARSWWERIGAAPVDEHNGTIDFNGYADARASRENAQGLGRKLYQTAEVSKPGVVAGPVVGVHFSREKRGVLSSSAFGTGLQGAERERLQNSNDDRIKQRIAFYVSNGKGVFPEAGVGSAAHVATLTNLYDADADALKLFHNNKRDANAAESAVVDAGFDGYLQRNNFNNQGTVVLLGARSVSAPHVGGLAEANAQTAVPPPAEIPAMKAAAIALANDKTLPGGALLPAKWKALLEARDPKLAAQIDFSKFKAGEPIYKDQLSGALWQEADQWYYSQLRRSVEQAPAKIFATGNSIKQWLLSNSGKLGIKKDEIEWTGITDWLDAQPKATKEDVLAFLDQGGVKVEEVMLGVPDYSEIEAWWNDEGGANEETPFGDLTDQEQKEAAERYADEVGQYSEDGDNTKFAQYVLPGGENYRELLLTLPVAKRDTSGWTAEEVRAKSPITGRPEFKVTDASGNEVGIVRTANDSEAAIAQAAATKTSLEGTFRSSHFDQPNILTHIRFNERTDTEGNRVFFVEEIQADKGQRWRALKDRIAKGEASEAERAEFAGIDAMPFNETKAWTALAMKRVIAYAAENGFDKVAWTTGEQQADRYSLAKKVDSLTWLKNADGTFDFEVLKGDETILSNRAADAAWLEDHIGKDLASKIVKDEYTSVLEGKSQRRFIEGDGLKVGGEGMKGFYDQIVPQVARDVLKKLGGGALETISVPRKGREGKSMRPEDVVRQKAEGTLTEQPGFTITPEMRATVAQGLPLFAAKNEDKLGFFRPKTLELGLLADANLSTFLHELGHFYLTVYADLASLPDAPPEIVKGMAAILKEFGIADLATWNAMPLELQMPYHERFAESFEQYLFTGKAPSLELQPLFQRFASWLTRVYSSIKDFIAGHKYVDLNPELAAVFDRMLATENEIAAANAARGFVALFKDAAEAGMSDKDFAAYTALSVDQKTDAEEMLRTRGLRDMKWLTNRRNKIIAELQADAKEKRDAVMKDVAAEVAAEPARRAARYLKRGQLLNPEGMDVALLGIHKLQISAVAEMFPESALAPQPDWKKLGYGQYGMLAEIGLTPDEVAERVGLSSGDELVRQLLGLTKFSDEVNALTDQRMLEQYGDLSNQDAISRAADEAIHNDARTRMVATELSALAKNIGAPSVLMKAAREYARQIIETKSSKTLKPWGFAAAETRAGKAALDALRKGDREKAASEKRTELVNHVSAKEAYVAEKEIKKIIDRFKKLAAYNDESSAVKSRDFATVNAVRAVLFDFGIGSDRKGLKAHDYLGTVKEHDPATGARLEELIAEMSGIVKPWDQIPLSQLRELSDSVKDLWDLASRTRAFEIEGKLVALEEIDAQLYAVLEDKGIPARVPGEGQAVTDAEKIGLMFETVKSVTRRMEQWADGLDGNRVAGPFSKYVIGVIKDAESNYLIARAEVLETYGKLLDAIRPSLAPRLIDAHELGYVFGKGTGGSGVAELLHAVLHTGNDSNKRKLLLGRGWAVLRDDGSMDTAKWDAFVKRMHDTGVLTKAHYDFAQGVWDLLESMKPAAQAAHRSVFGRFFSEITANSLTTPFGEYRGGYVPAQTDTDIVKDAEKRKLQEQENDAMTLAFPTPAKGFAQSRVDNYNRELLLDLRALAGHINKVMLFSHMTVPINDVRRALGRPRISSAINRIYPKAINGMITPWLNRAAKHQTSLSAPEFGGAGSFWSRARANAGMSRMMANVSNTLQQVTGVLSASLKMEKPSYLMKALGSGLFSHSENVEFVTSRSKYMRVRIENEVSAASHNIHEILLNPSVYDSAKNWTARHAYFLQSMVDNYLSSIIWTAGYNEVKDRVPGIAENDAVHVADELIRQTQGATGPTDLATYEAGHPFFQLFTQFAGWSNTQAQLLGNSWTKNLARDVGLPQKFSRALFIVGIGFYAQAVVAELIAQIFRGGPDDEDKDGQLIDDWLQQVLVMGPVKFGVGLTLLPGRVVMAAINAMNDKPYDDKINTAPAISALESGLKLPKDTYDAIFKNGKPSKPVKDFAELIGLFTGLPAAPLARPVGYLSDVAAGKVAPTGPFDLTQGIITGTASPGSKK